MTIKLENVGIAVRDLEEAISFFTDLGLAIAGRDTVSGEWTDTAVGLDGNHAKIAVLQTPDGHGQLELFEIWTIIAVALLVVSLLSIAFLEATPACGAALVLLHLSVGLPLILMLRRDSQATQA